MVIKACYSPWKLAFMAALIGFLPLLGLAVTVLEVYLRTTGQETGPVDVELFIYIPLLLLLTPLFILYVLRLFDREPVLVIDETGIFDRRWVDRAIPWTGVAWSSVARIGGQSSIWLKLSTPLSDYTTGGSKGLFARLGAFTGMLTLSCTELNVSADAIQTAIDQYLPPRSSQ